MKNTFYLAIISLFLVGCAHPAKTAYTLTPMISPLPISTTSPNYVATETPTSTINSIITPTILSSPFVTIPAPISCGSWGSQDSALGVAISQKYGELRNCLFFDNSWIILTLGLKGQSGVVAVYHCEPTDANCLDSEADHPLSGWKFYEPPCPGGLTLQVTDETTGKIMIAGGCLLWFDLANDTFTAQYFQSTP